MNNCCCYSEKFQTMFANINNDKIMKIVIDCYCIFNKCKLKLTTSLRLMCQLCSNKLINNWFTLSKSAKSDISSQRLRIICWYSDNLAGLHSPLPSMMQARTAMHSKSFTSKNPLLSMSDVCVPTYRKLH